MNRFKTCRHRRVEEEAVVDIEGLEEKNTGAVFKTTNT